MGVQLVITLLLFTGAFFFLKWLYRKWFGPPKPVEETPSEREARLKELREQQEALTEDVEVTKEILETAKEVEEKEKDLKELDQKLNKEKE